MTNLLLIATSEGLVVCRREAEGWQEVRRGLEEKEVTTVMAREGVILAGTTEGVYRSDDEGQTWRNTSTGLTVPHVRWMAFHPQTSDLEFVGTEPANIFVSHNGGGAWRDCPEVPPLRQAGGWFLPYSPEAGCVRGFAFHGRRGYAAVEVGGMLVSDDGGETWRVAEGSTGKGSLSTPNANMIASDVHSVDVHPSSPDLVFAPTHRGLYRSEDGGKVWKNLYPCYCRAMWVDPTDANHIIFGPADSVDQGGRIEETHDGGQSWQLRMSGLPAKWPEHMVERFTSAEEQLLAVLSNGELMAASLEALNWQRILPEIENVNAVTVMG